MPFLLMRRNFVADNAYIESVEDNELADFSSFKVPNKILKVIGNLAQESYGNLDLTENPHNLTKDEWTLLEEVIVGFTNR